MDALKLRHFTAADVPPDALEGETLAVIGYGHLGRSMALNLRDAGYTPLIGNIEDAYARRAREEHFTVLPIADAIAQSTLAFILIADEIIPTVFEKEIRPALTPKSGIVFASGYTLAYDLIRPPEGVDVLMLAPRMGGEEIRERFLRGEGFISFLDVVQDVSGRGWQRLLGLAQAVGALRPVSFALPLRQEADLDLFVEQTLGALIGLAIMSLFAIGTEKGIPPEALILEMYMSGEMETVFRTFRERGFTHSAYQHGNIAMYGGYLRLMEFMRTGLPREFQRIWEEIHSGHFARQYQRAMEEETPLMAQARSLADGDHPLGRTEDALRELLRRLAGETS